VLPNSATSNGQSMQLVMFSPEKCNPERAAGVHVRTIKRDNARKRKLVLCLFEPENCSLFFTTCSVQDSGEEIIKRKKKSATPYDSERVTEVWWSAQSVAWC